MRCVQKQTYKYSVCVCVCTSISISISISINSTIEVKEDSVRDAPRVLRRRPFPTTEKILYIEYTTVRHVAGIERVLTLGTLIRVH